MFFPRIYKSWKQTQMKKYENVVERLDKNFFSGTILDIGCGPLYFEEFMKNKNIRAKIVAMDIDKDTVVKNKTNFSVIVASGDNLPFKTVFDKIISFDTMHLVNENDFKNVLKDGGYVLFSIFFNEESREEKINLLKKKLHGFKTVKEFEILGKENEYVLVARKFK